MSGPASPSNGRRSCPCGSGCTLDACCGQYLQGAAALTAEALMRSRFTANVLGERDYLMRTWHERTRPADLNPAEGPEWLLLEVRRVENGGAGDAEGVVEFIARFRSNGRERALHETSRFVRVEGRWLYLDGEVHPEPAPIPRNAPCPCGSGRKHKRCCASSGR